MLATGEHLQVFTIDMLMLTTIFAEGFASSAG